MLPLRDPPQILSIRKISVYRPHSHWKTFHPSSQRTNYDTKYIQDFIMAHSTAVAKQAPTPQFEVDPDQVGANRQNSTT